MFCMWMWIGIIGFIRKGMIIRLNKNGALYCKLSVHGKQTYSWAFKISQRREKLCENEHRKQSYTCESWYISHFYLRRWLFLINCCYKYSSFVLKPGYKIWQDSNLLVLLIDYLCSWALSRSVFLDYRCKHMAREQGKMGGRSISTKKKHCKGSDYKVLVVCCIQL